MKELAALRARIEELERKAKPPTPFKLPDEERVRFDPTAQMKMPQSAYDEMAKVGGFYNDRYASSPRSAIPDSMR